MQLLPQCRWKNVLRKDSIFLQGRRGRDDKENGTLMAVARLLEVGLSSSDECSRG